MADIDVSQLALNHLPYPFEKGTKYLTSEQWETHTKWVFSVIALENDLDYMIRMFGLVAI